MLPAFYLCFMMEIAVQQADQIGFPHRIFFPERRRHNREGVRNTVFGVGKRQFRHRRQRGYRSFAVTTVHRVRPRRERRSGAASIRRIASLLPVHDVRGDGQNGLRRHRIAIRRQHANFLHKAFHQVAGDAVHALIVVAVLRILAFNSEVDGKAIFVANRFHLSVPDGGQGIRRHRQSGDAARHRPIHITVVQRHQRSFIAVLIVHVVNDVQRANVLHRQPVHKMVEALHYRVVIQHLIR